MAPSHIKAPAMPPPASVLLTAAGAIPTAPVGVRPPKGPPPKGLKSTVEDKFIKAVWNIDDIPVAPSHIRAPGGKQRKESKFNVWLTKARNNLENMSDYARRKYEILAR